MKVAVSCLGKTLEDDLDPRFGRAANFLIVDTETMVFNALDNAAQSASGGAGIAAAQQMIEQKIDAIITGQLGPNAMNVLSDAGVPMYQGMPGSVHDNVVAFSQNKLTPITSSGPAHAGMGHQGGRP